MAYGVKYRLEFTDIQQDEWKVEILENIYTGPVTSMIPSGTPLTVEWLTPGDEVTLSPIKGSIVTLNVECTTNFEYFGLYDTENLVRPMNIYINEVLKWSGWLTNDYTEPYDAVPYTVSITAADALGILKNLPYKNGNTTYTGRESETDIILRILGKIGKTQFTEYCNIYEDRMADGVADSPFDQAFIDNDLFIDADCYSVLNAILLKYNAVIRQQAGEFIIYRPAELVNDMIYGRVITSSGTTGTSMAPDKVIDREAMGLIDFNGGVMMIQAPMSKFTAKQDYGYKDSWLKNYNFKTWDISSEFANWTRVGSFGIFPAKDGGITFITPPGSAGANNAHYIYQDFGTHGKASASDVVRLRFDYDIDNQTGVPADVTIKIALYDDTRVHNLSMLDDTEIFQWDNGSYNRIQWTVTDVTPGLNSYKFDQSVMGIPCDGGFHIRLFYTVENTYLTIKNLQFLITSDQLNRVQEVVKKWIIPGLLRYGYMRDLPVEVADREEVIGREYIVANSISGEDGSQSYIIGDVDDTGMVNVLEQFEGSLAINLSGSLSQTAVDFVNSHAAAYAPGGVVVSSAGNELFFTSDTPGTNFTGSTTITNASGNLAGTVSTVTANSTGTVQVETITLSGGSGAAEVYAFDLNWSVTWNASLTQTAADFVTAWAADFMTYNITLTSSGEDILLTEATAAGGFTAPTITNTSGTLTGTVYHTQAAAPAAARVDKIVLTGTSGTANILCDGVTRLVTYNTDTVLTHTTSWHTRGGSEAQPLAELIGDEVAELYSRGRQFIQLNLYELTEQLDIIGNLQDPLNKIGADNRVFAFNRGALDCQAREWTADYIEVGTK